MKNIKYILAVGALSAICATSALAGDADFYAHDIAANTGDTVSSIRDLESRLSHLEDQLSELNHLLRMQLSQPADEKK